MGRRRKRAIGMVLLAAAALLATGCGGAGGRLPGPAAEYGAEFAGSYDEVIGADGNTAANFVDADYTQLRRRDDIPPIYAPELAAASDANLPDDAPVIGLAVNGMARAYPVGILYRREMVNDIVGGVPALVSWCPLCYTALAHDRRRDGAALVFGNQGALYKGGMTWYDHATGSVWSQPLGSAIAGPLAGAELPLLPSQLTTWGKWRAAYPETLALVDAAAAQPYRGRRPGAGHIVGVSVGGAARAWPYSSVAEGVAIRERVGGDLVVVWRDELTGAIRAVDGDTGRERPVIIAYRTAWLRFYPAETLDDGGGWVLPQSSP